MFTYELGRTYEWGFSAHQTSTYLTSSMEGDVRHMNAHEHSSTCALTWGLVHIAGVPVMSWPRGKDEGGSGN